LPVVCADKGSYNSALRKQATSEGLALSGGSGSASSEQPSEHSAKSAKSAKYPSSFVAAAVAPAGFPLSARATSLVSAHERSSPGGSGQATLVADNMTDASSGDSEAFCGDMDSMGMMGGFTSVFSSERHMRPCVGFLFPGLVLDSPGKFLLGCWFTLLLGVAAEGSVALARRVSWATSSAVCLKFAIHAVTMFLGYALMLLVMEYSIELTFSAILGLCIGRVVFQGWLNGWPKAVWSSHDEEKRTACCTD